MGLIIDDGAGKNGSARVNNKQELTVRATAAPVQHEISEKDGQAYQIIGEFSGLANSTHTVLHLRNKSADKMMFVTYMRLAVVGAASGTAFPNVLNYWQIGSGRTVGTGGSATIAANVNRSSSNTADVTGTNNNPTMTGTFTELDRHYTKEDGEEVVYNKEASLALGKDDTLEIRYVTNHTTGTVYARVSFFMEASED